MNDEKLFKLDREREETFACVDEYERSVSGDSLPDLRVVLDRIRPADTRAALLELIKTDLEYRWRRNDPREIGSYLDDFPELNSVEESVQELISAEAEARRSAQDLTISSSALFERRKKSEETSGLPPFQSTVRGKESQNETWQDYELPSEIEGYRCIKQVGEGGFGTVMHCADLLSGKEVAVKIAKAEWGDEVSNLAKHEASSVNRVRHPNIVQLLGNGELPDGRPYLMYDFVHGRTLSRRFKEKNYTTEEAIEWIAQIAGALHHAHLAGLVHRDIKPANIIIDDNGKPWLTDFGLAKLDDQFVTDDSGIVLGTLSYMPPEQAGGRAHWATPQSDVYSLGVLLYEALCRQPPFKSSDRDELLDQVRERPPRPPRSVRDDVPRQLAELCMKALAKNPSERIQTAEDFERAIRDYQLGVSTSQASLAAGGAQTPEKRRPLWLPLAAAVLLGAAGVWGSVAAPGLFSQTDQAPAPARPIEVTLDLFFRTATGTVPRVAASSDLPFKPGVFVNPQAKVNATQAGYFYLFGVQESGVIERLSEPVVSDGEPSPEFALNYEPYHELKGDRGVALYMVGVAHKPLTEEQLKAIEETPVKLPAPVTESVLPRAAEPWPENQFTREEIARGKERGANKRGGEGGTNFSPVMLETYAVPDAVRKLMNANFDGYHAVIFSYGEAE